MNIYPRLSSIFTFIKLASYSAWFFLFLKRKILITFNAEDKAFWKGGTSGTYLEQEIQGMLKSSEAAVHSDS